MVVAGRGNNGGDGFVAAAELAARGRDVSIILLCERDSLQGDAALAARGWTYPVLPFNPQAIGRPALIIDDGRSAGRGRGCWCRLGYGGGSGWCVDRVGGPPDQVACNPRSQHESHDQSSQRRPIHETPRKSDRTLIRRLCKHCGVWTSARESSSVWRAYHAFGGAVERRGLSGPANAY